MPNHLDSFDLYRIFFGNESTSCIFLAEIFFRTLFMYSYTLINIRFMDKRSIGQISSFELIIVIALGSAVGDPMFYPNIPLIHAMIVITTIVLIERFISIWSDKSAWLERLISGTPTLLIKNGEINKKALKKENFTAEDLFARLRLHGIKNVGQVEYAFLERSGQLSVIQYKKSVDEKKGRSTLVVD